MACSYWGWLVFGQTSICSYAKHTPLIFSVVFRQGFYIYFQCQLPLAIPGRTKKNTQWHLCLHKLFLRADKGVWFIQFSQIFTVFFSDLHRKQHVHSKNLKKKGTSQDSNIQNELLKGSLLTNNIAFNAWRNFSFLLSWLPLSLTPSLFHLTPWSSQINKPSKTKILIFS